MAVAIAARDFAQRRLDDCAVLRVLGAPQRAIAWSYALEFCGVGLVASVLGVVLGLGVHLGFVALLGNLIEGARLPAPSVMPALFGLGVGMTLLVSFGLPPVLQLARVPPLRVIRRDLGALRPASLAVLGAGVLGFVALLLAASSDLKLGGLAVGGFAAAVVVLAALSWLAVRALKAAVPESRAPRWLVLATRQVAARPAFAMLQVSALGVGLAGVGAAGAAAHRPHQQLARRHAGRCAQPLRDQPAARSGAAVSRAAARIGRQAVRLVPDDPRPPGDDQRQARSARTTSPTSAPSAWSSASST